MKEELKDALNSNVDDVVILLMAVQKTGKI